MALVGTSGVSRGLIFMRASTLAVKPPQAMTRLRVLSVLAPCGDFTSTTHACPSGLKPVTGVESASLQPKRLRCAMSAST